MTAAGHFRAPRATEAEKLKAKDLRSQGLSYRQIGIQLGRSGKTIQLWCDPIAAEKQQIRRSRWNNANRERKRISDLRYITSVEHGRARSRAICAQRRAMKLECYTHCPDDIAAMQAIYLECERLSRETGFEHHVDHIQPLSVGGPHLPHNLQILTAEENLSKGGKYRSEDQALYALRIALLFND